jgi:hypothetical protein
VTRLRDVRPEEVLRAGAVFGQVAEQLADTVTRCRPCADVRWNGPPVLRYQEHLRSLVRTLSTIQTSYDEACDALLSYSRALEPVRDLALQADLLEAQAEDLKRARNLLPDVAELYAPMTPAEEAVRQRAALLRAQAEDGEHAASLRASLVLQQLADDAPRLSGWTSAGRLASQFAQGANDQLQGTVDLAFDGVESLPLVGSAESRAAARKRLWAEGKALMQPWLAIEDLLNRLADGEYAYTGGALSAGMVLRIRGAKGKAYEKFGAHDEMPLDVLWGLKRGGYGDGDLTSIRQWVETRAQKQFLDELLSLEHAPLPSLDEMLSSGHVDLMLQEAHGSHTLLRHVGRDVDFLRHRQETEPSPDGPMSKSSFFTIDEAEAAVSTALIENASLVRRWVNGDQPRLKLEVPLREPAGIAIDERGMLSDAREIVLRFVRDRDGSIRINTAYVEPGS